MGHGKIGVSNFALTVSAAIRAQMGIHRISNRDLSKVVGRGPTYVNSRVNDENEWALGDLEKICRAWNMSPCELIESVSTEQSRIEETLRRVQQGDMTIAAYETDSKRQYLEYGDGQESA
ncbi:helix-turn-helix domain-containing protein [Bifidobacterium tissieri]|uniref:helix-turn-helix domain-containing protein n=1 Tax=Bifidobacterium tissieri TaxID=1630162 RepID=UPI00123BE856|nr:helix-turn-helix transcriptional regulator [Bifidobacterium tissieri]KAA8832579.1 hypothetical protein EM849_03475 [Bifidobacterium tissieri]